MKLGGWHRLWIFISVLLLVAIGILGIAFFPKVSSISHEEGYYEALSPEAKSQLETGSSENVSSVRMENGHIIKLKQGIEPKQSTAVLSEYSNLIKQKLLIERTKYVGILLAIWVVASLTIYLFGLAIGWIYRGFKSNENAP